MSESVSPIFIQPARTARLFFERSDLTRIRDNARSVLFSHHIQLWRRTSQDALRNAWDQFLSTGNIYHDFRQVLTHFGDLSTLHLAEPTPERERLLLDTIAKIMELPCWDHVLDGDEPLGLLFSGSASFRLLFAREVLDGAMDHETESALLRNIGDKVGEPCYRAVWGMDHPEQALNWRSDPEQEFYQNIDTTRWALIFGSCNLRTISTVGLGFAALALMETDDRAERWLSLAESSARAVFGLFAPDGSYFEGLSYGNMVGNLLTFCRAHRKLLGTIDWSKAMNYSGYVDFILNMQMGRTSDGAPDIVNFSDARDSVWLHIAAMIGQETGDARAQWIAENCSLTGHFMDFVLYDPALPSHQPVARLKTCHNELDWFVSRTGWRDDDAVLALRSGFPANHEHADRNSIIYKVHGERLLTDHLGAAYARDNASWELRLTRAHNAVLIDGEGHQYHEGEEGTNASESVARITRLEESRERVWVQSDATTAYRLVNHAVQSVVRTVAFAKPNIVVVVDQVSLTDQSEPLPVEVRFFPDNSEDSARLETSDGSFAISLPKASLFAAVYADGAVNISQSMLQPMPPRATYNPETAGRTVSREFGRYPFVSLVSAPRRSHTIVSLLVAIPGKSPDKPDFSIEATENHVYCSAENVKCGIDLSCEPCVIMWA